MTPEQQRIAIAEACGATWTEIDWMRGEKKRVLHIGKMSNCFQTCGEDENQFSFDSTVPDYLGDLNAMHKAEKTFLTTPGRIQYYDAVLDNVCPGNPIHATATQRAEAFLRTLNLWKDQP